MIVQWGEKINGLHFPDPDTHHLEGCVALSQKDSLQETPQILVTCKEEQVDIRRKPGMEKS